MTVLLQLLSFVAIFGGGMWAVRRYGAARAGGGSAPLQVLGRANLGKNASVALIQVGERAFTIGVGNEGVSLLAEVDVPPTPEPAPQPAGGSALAAVPAWASSLQERTGPAVAASLTGLRRLARSSVAAASVASVVTAASVAPSAAVAKKASPAPATTAATQSKKATAGNNAGAFAAALTAQQRQAG